MGGMRAALASIAASLLMCFSGTALADGQPDPPLTIEQIRAAKGVTQVIPLMDGAIEVELLPGYVFIPAAEVPPLLQKLAVAPPDGQVLGALAPLGKTPDSKDYFASIITYHAIGHVPETGQEEIASITFFDTVKTARGPAGDALEGFPITPTYDGANKALAWAERYRAASQADRDLKHEQRLLGRTAVAGLTTIGRNADLEAVRKAAPKLLSMVTFPVGNRYGDYVSASDRDGEYDLPGLITGQRRAQPAEVETASAGPPPPRGPIFGFLQNMTLSGEGMGWFQWVAMAMVAFALSPYPTFQRELRGVA